MKKSDIPQDESALSNYVKELCYAVDENGKYATGLSTGWEVKAQALNLTLSDVQKRVNDAIQKVKNKEASPILVYMEANMMDIGILSAYTGFWKFTIKRHLKPKIFQTLSNNKLQKYAEVFNVSIEQLKTMHDGVGV